ncbi:hypothetical protein GCM10027072_51240 [Streptomyces bullii]
MLWFPEPGELHANGGPPEKWPAVQETSGSRGLPRALEQAACHRPGSGGLRASEPGALSPPGSDSLPPSNAYAAFFALVAYMSTYSCPDSRMTSAITESVTARST